MTFRRAKILLIVLFVVAIVGGAVFSAGKAFDKQLEKSGRALVVDVVTRQINLTCQDVLADTDGDFFLQNLLEDNTINLTVNNDKTALLAGKAAIACARDLEEFETMTLAIPRGAFTNSAYLADKGRKTNYTVSAAYTVSCDYHVSYEAVGINQIRYAIYLNVTTVAHILIPRQLDDVTYVYAVPICEKIYSGEVPNVYVNGEDATDFLDLLPD